MPIPAKIGPLAKNGSLTMLALDQRGSLRTIIAAGADEASVGDDRLIEFKAAAAEILSPLASAVLLDSGLGRKAMARIAPGVPLILSADKFDQKPGGPVDRSVVDPAVTPALIEELKPAALKLLVIWKQGTEADFRKAVLQEFVDLAGRTGRIALVEGIVRTAANGRFGDARAHGEAVIEAAAELCIPGVDLYKAEVPGYLPGEFDRISGFAAQLSRTIAQPWVVLSNGVAAQDFAQGVKICCENGASGFLAGRAIWADSASKSDPREELRRESLPRMQNLVGIVAAARSAKAA